MTKITLTTVKSFIRKNGGKLYINQKSTFDGMVDGVRSIANADFSPALTVPARANGFDNQQGIQGAWFVGGSRDYFSPYDDGKFTGFSVSNCCGQFILAIEKGAA